MTDKKHRGMDSKINHCMWSFADFVARSRPIIAVFESVRQAYTNGRDLMQRLRVDVETKTNLKYELYHVMHNAYDLGGAALRPRYFWVISQVPFGVEYPVLKRQPELIDVIGDLDTMGITWNAQAYRQPASWWLDEHKMRSTTNTVDGHAVRDGLATRRALDLLQLANETTGGWPENWHIGKMARHVYETTGRLPKSWSHLTEKLISVNWHMGFTSLTRWDMKRAGRVVTGGALNLVLHPSQPRCLTHREAARVMGFPDDWAIKPLKNYSALPLTWGKGITVQCGKWIGSQVINALDGLPGTYTGQLIGEREWLVSPPKNSVKPHRVSTFVNNFDIVNTATQVQKHSYKETVVTSPNAPETEATEATEAASGRGRGRPRPETTIERDNKVLSFVTDEPQTREDLAAKLTEATGTEVKPGLVYLSLYRLRRAGAVQSARVNGKHSWTRTANVEVPAFSG
jgi:site-specific DNA-cytosine methylase